MPAPKGNQFWLARSSHGRKPIFASASDLHNACEEYFKWNAANPLYDVQPFAFQGKVELKRIPKIRAMTIGGLCIFLDIDKRTWCEWHRNKDFIPVVTQVEEIIRNQKFAGAAAGLLNANIIARDLGLADKSELTGKDGGPIQTVDLTNATEEQLAAIEAVFGPLAGRGGHDEGDQGGEGQTRA